MGIFMWLKNLYYFNLKIKTDASNYSYLKFYIMEIW